MDVQAPIFQKLNANLIKIIQHQPGPVGVFTQFLCALKETRSSRLVGLAVSRSSELSQSTSRMRLSLLAESCGKWESASKYLWETSPRTFLSGIHFAVAAAAAALSSADQTAQPMSRWQVRLSDHWWDESLVLPLLRLRLCSPPLVFASFMRTP